MTDFNVPKDFLGTRLAFVPGLYSLKQLKKMREKLLVGDTFQSPSIPDLDHLNAKSDGKMPFANRGTYINNEDSSDDDEISVISVKMAPKPIRKPVASFETTLMNNFNVGIKSEQMKEVNELSGKGLNQVKMDNKINDDMYGGTFTNFPATGNEKKVLDKQLMIENLRKELLNEAEQLEEKMISLNKQEKHISELNKMVECLTKEKEIYLKNENKNKREMHKIKASFVERNLEVQELQNKVVLLTNNLQCSEESRKQNENVIENFKLSKNTSVEKENEIMKLNTIINNLKTDLKVLPMREMRLEELQMKVNILSEKAKDLELLKTTVLPEKDKVIGNLENKVIEMNKNDVEKNAVIDELQIKLNNSEKKATDSTALFWHTLGEKEKNIETLEEKVTELTKNKTDLDVQLTEKIKDLSDKENFIVHLQQKVATFIEEENGFNLKLDEINKEMLKKEEIIEYFEGKVNDFSKKEKEFEEFKAKLLDEKEQNEQTIVKLIERSNELEQAEISLQFEKGRSCDLELRVTKLTDKNNELQELNENYDLKVNSLRSELVEANISNMFESASHDSESERQLEDLLKEKENLMEQNNNLLLEISAKKKESVALQNKSIITISTLESVINENKLESERQLENLLKEKEYLLEQNNNLLLEISAKEKESAALRNESKITISSLESVINENKSMQQELSNKLQEATDELQKTNEKEKSTLDYTKWLENKLDEKRRLLTSTSEANQVLNKKYSVLKTEKDDLIKEVRDISALQIKIKSLEEQLMKAREENGEEPGLIIDDQIDEPSTSRSAKLSLPSARDPRRKSAEARQTTPELMNSSSGEYREQMGPAQPHLPFSSIFDIPASSPRLKPEPNLAFAKPPKSTSSLSNLDLDVPAISLSNSTISTFSPTSHLNAGLSQLSTWMKKNTIKNLSDYKPLSVSVSPQKKYSEDYSSSWSQSSSAGEETKTQRSHKRSRERRISGQNSPNEKKLKREESELKERSDWNVIPEKYLNFLTERKKFDDNLPGELENVSIDF